MLKEFRLIMLYNRSYTTFNGVKKRFYLNKPFLFISVELKTIIN